MKKRILSALLLAPILLAALAGCNKSDPEETEQITPSSPYDLSTNKPGDDAVKLLRLYTTIELEESGLLEHILPNFTEESGWALSVVATAADNAFWLAQSGQADVLLMNVPDGENAFIADGYGLERIEVMYNDFIVVGPKDGNIPHNSNIKNTFVSIYEYSMSFVSRGESSGAKLKEDAIWKSISVNPESFSGYLSAGKGMSETLTLAAELSAYTLTDSASWLIFEDKGDLDLICSGSPDMRNTYAVTAVNPDVSRDVSAKGAQAFIDWITGETAQKLIGSFGTEKYGQPLFNSAAN